ncbi:HAMP domain-containing histidine kinase [Vallitalea pronyensis]|uniref:histidine kinase n=1 Tax=Vallitalea pronyensis TaxID=1348613 RepID=A0A8J8SGY6_9FIRM|nr:HAMP domain-containing sensor histidine kinase [Vallitalea pronyensis]QUI23275.1 HAMP domain-containing histidine kinase [Vallitalea pronyensis]
MHNIRFKVLLMCFQSAVLSALTLLGVYSILVPIRRTTSIRNLINLVQRYLTVTQAMIAFGIICFIIYLLILVSGLVKYIGEISQRVSEIAGGNLDIKIDKITRDELGQLAVDINTMTTQLKQLISEERQTNETKNYLITSLSHDLKTPLTSIYGYLELINNDDYKDEVELRYYTQIAYRKTIQLRKMIDQLFDYTKFSDSHMVLDKIKIDVKELINQLVVEYYPYFLKKKLECRVHVGNERYEVHGDSQLLLRVFENLMSNAVRYSGENSKHIDITLEVVYNHVHIHFTNYNNIIPVHQQPYIFNQFYKIEHEDHDMESSGLGLAIAKNIVEMHGGEITVDSHDNQTTFTLSFDLYHDNL